MSATTGSCLCGAVKIEFSGEPKMHALCHCDDCRKISGGMFSNNFIVSNDSFKLVSGSPKTYEKVADSGKKIVSYFCGDCGTTLYRQGDSFGPMTVIKGGVLNNSPLLDATPGAELFSENRAKFIPAVSGAKQVQGMSG